MPRPIDVPLWILALATAFAVVFGKPLLPQDFDPGKDAPDRFREASRRIMAKIAELEPPQEPKM